MKVYGSLGITVLILTIFSLFVACVATRQFQPVDGKVLSASAKSPHFPVQGYSDFARDWLKKNKDDQKDKAKDGRRFQLAPADSFTSGLFLKQAKVLAADYDLIRRDFSELRDLSDKDIDAWLLMHGAIITSQQLLLAQRPVNSSDSSPIQSIPTTALTYAELSEHQLEICQRLESCRGLLQLLEDNKARLSFPYGYGRAGIVTAGVQGLSRAASDISEEEIRSSRWMYLDAKGIGVHGYAIPKAGGHSNGLIALSEALREFVHSKLVKKILLKAKKDLSLDAAANQGSCGLIPARRESTLLQQYLLEACSLIQSKSPRAQLNFSGMIFAAIDAYAVIDAGFTIDPAGSGEQAGILLRQAHHRKNGSMDDVAGDLRHRMESALILRAFGVTLHNLLFKERSLEESTIDTRDYVTRNEMDVDGRLVDFGTLLVHGGVIKFPNGLFYQNSDQSWAVRAKVLVSKDELKPIENLAVDTRFFGFNQAEQGCLPEGDPRCDILRRWTTSWVERWRGADDQQLLRRQLNDEIVRRLQAAIP